MCMSQIFCLVSSKSSFERLEKPAALQLRFANKYNVLAANLKKVISSVYTPSTGR
jgi:hypothetical protein